MLHVLRNRHFSEVVLVDALLTGAAGAVLFWRNTNGFELGLMTQTQTLGFTAGAVAGAIALLLFVVVGYPAGRRMVAIGNRLEVERRPPSEDEERILAISQRVLNRLGPTVLGFLIVAAAAMATARYWPLVL